MGDVLNRFEMYHEILVTWMKLQDQIVDQLIIRCNYTDKFTYLKPKDKCINEIKQNAYVQNVTKTTHRQFSKSSL
jgi:hypothetical protein